MNGAVRCEMLAHRFDDEKPPAEYLLTGIHKDGARDTPRKACNDCVVRVRTKVARQAGAWAGRSIEARSLRS